jgi:hypothetical protein
VDEGDPAMALHFEWNNVTTIAATISVSMLAAVIGVIIRVVRRAKTRD